MDRKFNFDRKLNFDIGKYVRRWGVEFVLEEIVDYMEAMDQSEQRFAELTKEVKQALYKYKVSK